MHHLLSQFTSDITDSDWQTVELANAAYPTRAIRIVLGSSRNSAIETIAKVFASRLGVELGQPVMIDSRPDMGGTLALAPVGRSAPDGHTLLMTSTTTMSIAPHLYNKIEHDPRDDFVPVAMVSLLPCGVAVNSFMPATDLQSHIEWLKNSGGKVDGIYAPPGTSGAIVDKLAVAINRAIHTADVRAQLAKQGVDLVLLTGPAVRAFLDQEDESRLAACSSSPRRL